MAPQRFEAHEKKSVEESVMNSPMFRKAILVSVLAAAVLAFGCGSNPEGKYRDPTGSINVELKGGKAYIALGAYAVNGTYTVEGKKITARGDFGMMIPNPLVLTINDDGSIQGPSDTMIPKLDKVK
jgi:hypothetical protein